MPQNSVTERLSNVSPTEPSPGLHLPAFEAQDFRAFNPYPGVLFSTVAPFVDSGFVSSTPAPSFDASLLVSSTPAPSFSSGLSYTTPAPSLAVSSGESGLQSVPQSQSSGVETSTPAPNVDATSGSQENLNLNLNAQLPGFSFNAFTTPAPTVFSSTVAPTVSTLAPGFGLGSSYSFPGFGGFGLGYSTPAPILGSGGFTSVDSSLFGSDAALNSVNVQGVTSGGSGGAQTQQVSKHLYFYAAPEDPEPPRTRINVAPAPPPKKNVKIIFIKTPTPPAPAPISIAAPPQDEEKTIVYVLVKKPEDTQNVEIQTQPPSPPPKPEVYFIKYKTPQEAEEAIAKVQGSAEQGSGPSVPAAPVGGSELLTSINNESPVPSVPVVNYVASTTSAPPLNFNYVTSTTPAPLLNLNYVSTTSTPAPPLSFIGGGISGPIYDSSFKFQPRLDDSDIRNNLISFGVQPTSLYTTAAPYISSVSTGDSGLLASTTPTPIPHVTYGPPGLKK